MIYYNVEFDINSFEFWSGAKERVDNATPEQMSDVEQRIEEHFADYIPDENEINEFVWFDCDDIFFPDEQ